MSLSKQIAVVTGGAGFLGSHTVEQLLENGFRVRVLDLPGVNIEANLGGALNDPNLTVELTDPLRTDATSSFFANVDYLFHCSGTGEQVESAFEPERLLQTNIMDVVRILAAARHFNMKKVIYSSSAAIYGIAKAPTSESAPANPRNVYGLSKEIAEVVFRRWSAIYNVPSVCFRIFNGYGPRAARSGVVGMFLEKKIAGKPIRILGDGSAERDFIYVSDIVDAFLLAVQNDTKYSVYNIGSGKPRTVRELAELIGGPIEFGPPRDGEPKIILADTHRISTDLGWVPKISLEDGVKHTLTALGLSH